jgi:TrbC/VIRB2 pilin
MSQRTRLLAVPLVALASSSPGLAQASAASEAGRLIGHMMSAGIAIGTLVLVMAGYMLWAGQGNRSALGMWLMGLAVLLSAPWLASKIAG